MRFNASFTYVLRVFFCFGASIKVKLLTSMLDMWAVNLLFGRSGYILYKSRYICRRERNNRNITILWLFLECIRNHY